MRKKAIIPILICALFLSGCSFTKYFSVASIETVILYDEVETVLKEDLISGKYSDIMLPTYISDLWVTRAGTLQTETRALAGSSETSASYYPQCTVSDTLGNWIKSSTCDFTFRKKSNNTVAPDELYVSTYSVKNHGSSSSFRDYLAVMSALSQYYGECTIELYRIGNSVVSISEMQQSLETDEIIEKLSDNFEAGILSLNAQWIDKAYDIQVNFNSPTDCSIVYTMKI